MTLVTKLQMAVAGCSGSSSAKIWHWFWFRLAPFFATKPNIRLLVLPDKIKKYIFKYKVIRNTARNRLNIKKQDGGEKVMTIVSTSLAYNQHLTYSDARGSPESALCCQRRSSGSVPQWLMLLTGKCWRKNSVRWLSVNVMPADDTCRETEAVNNNIGNTYMFLDTQKYIL